MKLLVALNLFQLVILLFVLTKMFHLQDKQIALETALHTFPAPITYSTEDPSDTASQAASIQLATIRNIVRQELAPLLTKHQQKGVESPTEGLYSSETPSEDSLERLQRVRDELAMFKAIGEISEAEMAHLQVNIAELEPQNRKEMLGQLMRALSSGELKGRL